MSFKKINEAPKSGILYALCKDKMIYKQFEHTESGGIFGKFFCGRKSNDEIEKLQKKKAAGELLELHIFDNNTEYRYVKRSGMDDIECVINDKEMLGGNCDDETYKKMYTYKECVYVPINSHNPQNTEPFNPDKADDFKGYDKVTVVNYIEYDENGMIRIANYRYSTECKNAGEEE